MGRIDEKPGVQAEGKKRNKENTNRPAGEEVVYVKRWQREWGSEI